MRLVVALIILAIAVIAATVSLLAKPAEAQVDNRTYVLVCKKLDYFSKPKGISRT